MNVLTTEHKNLSSNPTKHDRAVTATNLSANLHARKDEIEFRNHYNRIWLTVLLLLKLLCERFLISTD